MAQYTPAERSDIVELYIENKKSITLTQRKFRAKFPRKSVPDPKTIRALYAKFISTGVLSNVPRSIIARRARSNTNINMVRDHVEKYPNLSIRQRSTALGLNAASLQRILKDDLKLVPHKVK